MHRIELLKILNPIPFFLSNLLFFNWMNEVVSGGMWILKKKNSFHTVLQKALGKKI